MWRKTSSSWAQLQDPSDSAGFGSVWPLIGTSYVTDRAASVGFVTTGENATSITQWLPGTTLYNRMMSLYNLSGGKGAKAVLWWQGETDAINGMSQATYHGHLSTLAAGIQADLGVKLIVLKLQNCTAINPASIANINAAITAAWSDIPNVAQGPDVSDLSTDDGYHLQSDAKVQLAASRWWTAIKNVFGW